MNLKLLTSNFDLLLLQYVCYFYIHIRYIIVIIVIYFGDIKIIEFFFENLKLQEAQILFRLVSGEETSPWEGSQSYIFQLKISLK